MSEVGCSLAELSSISLLFLSVFQWLQSGFCISTLIALVMHNMERISMDETLKNQRNEDTGDTGFIPELKIYTSWYHVSQILIPLHHEIGYLELLTGDWYMSLRNSLLVPVLLWYLISGQTYVPGPGSCIKRVIPDQQWYVPV
jgi:hypothetical protein